MITNRVTKFHKFYHIPYFPCSTVGWGDGDKHKGNFKWKKWFSASEMPRYLSASSVSCWILELLMVKSLWARQFGFPIIANPISQTSLFYTMLLKVLQEVILSRVHEEMEPEQKRHPAGDVTGDGNKIRCCKEQYFIGTWNVRSKSRQIGSDQTGDGKT